MATVVADESEVISLTVDGRRRREDDDSEDDAGRVVEATLLLLCCGISGEDDDAKVEEYIKRALSLSLSLAEDV